MHKIEWVWTSVPGERGRMVADVEGGLLLIEQSVQPEGWWDWASYECGLVAAPETLRFKGGAPTLEGAQMMAQRFAPGREDTEQFMAPAGMSSVMMYFDEGAKLTDAQNFRLQADKAVEADDQWREDLGGLWADLAFRKSLAQVSVGMQSGWREESKTAAINDPLDGLAFRAASGTNADATELLEAIAKKPAAINDPQPPPRPNLLPSVWSLVIGDMAARDKTGVAKYGVPLQPHNGRDALVDAYQEALDLCVYLRQAIYERDGGVMLPAEAP